MSHACPAAAVCVPTGRYLADIEVGPGIGGVARPDQTFGFEKSSDGATNHHPGLGPDQRMAVTHGGKEGLVLTARNVLTIDQRLVPTLHQADLAPCAGC